MDIRSDAGDDSSGFDSLRSDQEYDPLTRAARARSEADWLVGMNASQSIHHPP